MSIKTSFPGRQEIGVAPSFCIEIDAK